MFRWIAVAAASAALGAYAGWAILAAPGQTLAPGVGAAPPAVATPLDWAQLTAEERVNIDVYERVNRSVAHINTRAERGEAFWLFELPGERSGSGSGSVLDKQGHVVTNFHVVEGANQIAVTLFDGQAYEARLVGADPTSDVAVLKIAAPPESLFPVAIGDSTNLRVGQRVFAIGNPFGLERTLTTGVISSLNRSIPGRSNRMLKSMIQIDAAINPGNSGGPLLDSRGRLIGMNTAIASRTGQSSGVGFAIPVSTIAQLAPQLITNGRVVRPEIGILRVFQTEGGFLIDRLSPGGPAERAGLRGPQVVRTRRGPLLYEKLDRSAADLIVAIDERRVTTADEFLSYIESKRPGDSVTLTIVRGGQALKVPVQLGEAEG